MRLQAGPPPRISTKAAELARFGWEPQKTAGEVETLPALNLAPLNGLGKHVLPGSLLARRSHEERKNQGGGHRVRLRFSADPRVHVAPITRSITPRVGPHVSLPNRKSAPPAAGSKSQQRFGIRRRLAAQPLPTEERTCPRPRRILGVVVLQLRKRPARSSDEITIPNMPGEEPRPTERGGRARGSTERDLPQTSPAPGDEAMHERPTEAELTL